MAYDEQLAERLRSRLKQFSSKKITEKKMFSGLAFLIDGKMCINVSKDRIMCRFDPDIEKEVQSKKGYKPMVMKGKNLAGYCYVEKEGFGSEKNMDYWIKICLGFNRKAVSSKK